MQLFYDTITQNYQVVSFAPNRGDASHICDGKVRKRWREQVSQIKKAVEESHTKNWDATRQ